MDAEPPRCTLQDAKAREILDRRAVVSRDGDAAGAQPVGERTRAVAHERRFLARLGQVHRSEEHTSELQSQSNLVCRLLLEKKTKHAHYQPKRCPEYHTLRQLAVTTESPTQACS